MEIELRFDEVLSAHAALMQLIDRRFASVEMAVRVSDALRRVQPVFENLAQQYNAVIERHAKRDEEGNILYTDETKTQIVPLDRDAMNGALVEFFAGTIQVTLPRLSSAGLALSDGDLRLADVAPIAFLFEDLPTESVALSREAVLDVFGALDGLLDESFASSEALLKIARARHMIAGVVRGVLADRMGIVKEVEDDDVEDDGVENALRAFMQGQIAVEFPPLCPDDFTPAGDGALSPRQLYGLVPVLAQAVGA